MDQSPEIRDYLVAVDLLNGPRNEYSYLMFQLEALRAKPLLDTVWLVTTDQTAEELTADLARVLQDNDRLLVIRAFTDDCGSRNLIRPI